MSTEKSSKEVFRRIEQNADDLVRITQDLVRIPSVNPPGDYEKMVAKMVELYRAEGLSPEVIIAPKEKVEALGLTWPRPNVAALVEGRQRSLLARETSPCGLIPPFPASWWRIVFTAAGRRTPKPTWQSSSSFTVL